MRAFAPSLLLLIDPRACTQDALHKHLNWLSSLHLSSFTSLCPATTVTLLRVLWAPTPFSWDKIHTLPLVWHSPTSGPPWDSVPAILSPLQVPQCPSEASWAQPTSPGPDEERVGQALWAAFRGLPLHVSRRPPAHPQQNSPCAAVMMCIPVSHPHQKLLEARVCASLTLSLSPRACCVAWGWPNSSPSKGEVWPPIHSCKYKVLLEHRQIHPFTCFLWLLLVHPQS